MLTGVALDKLAKWERWEDGDDRERQSNLAELLSALTDRGGTVEVAARATIGPGGAAGERKSASEMLQRLGSAPAEVTVGAVGLLSADPVERAIDVTPGPAHAGETK